MSKLDLRTYKRYFREKYKKNRSLIAGEEKRKRDGAILKKLCEMPEYRKAGLVLCYVSKADEVGTLDLLERAWRDGKATAVPKCVENTRGMEFFEIESFRQLKAGAFGVMEPDEALCRKARDFSGSICIVPGLSFDNFGYRLGYGMGYYDRFLSGYDGVKVGLCYKSCMKYYLQHGRFDVPCDIIINESYVRLISGRGGRK
ncbi:MAG: 5-formyltetrahydrofolate cyclo-ligase [Oscillospiraceae bacterium]|jgi:5-formyltetrahydrofolate cyclo-ligase|nr:5-formyltetrahydrofolate cyclo-ligase [Oscillospiraceae bacterium]